MPKTSGFVTLALLGALIAAPAMAAPQFASTNDAPGSAGDRTVDCSDQQYRYMPYCQMINGPAASKVAPTTIRRLNTLNCPPTDLVPAGTDRNGNRLYRCAATSAKGMRHSPAVTFSPGY